MMDVQKPASIIKMAQGDPLYLGFLPALDTAMVAAWHSPKVRAESVATATMCGGGSCW